MDETKKKDESKPEPRQSRGRALDPYVELFESGAIPGGKASTSSFQAQLKRDIQDTSGKK